MYNYRIEIEYDGGRYDGWQRLGKDASTNTIESRLCEIIARMTGETVDMYVGSRTEKGVHALCQTANFKLEKLDVGNGIKKPEDVKRCLDGENVQMSLPAESYGLFLVKVVY